MGKKHQLPEIRQGAMYDIAPNTTLGTPNSPAFNLSDTLLQFMSTPSPSAEDQDSFYFFFKVSNMYMKYIKLRITR